MKLLVSQLYEALNIEEYQVAREQELVRDLEELQRELEPLENQRQEIIRHAQERTNLLTWAGLGLMATQVELIPIYKARCLSVHVPLLLKANNNNN